MTRANGIAYAVFFLVLTIGLRSGCSLIPNQTRSDQGQSPSLQQKQELDYPHRRQDVAVSRAPLIIGSFNIEIFGVAKLRDGFAMEKLVDVARRFDLLAIQELRAKDQTVIKNFVRLINADGSRYSYIVGDRQGYTVSKEQYIYLFDSTKLAATSQPYIATDPTGKLHRAPLVASFECINTAPGTGFTFTALNLHTDPDVVEDEFLAMEQVMSRVMLNHPNEDDFILLGDFNDDADGIQNFQLLRNQFPLIRSHWPTTPRSRRSLDNLVIDSLRTAEFRNQAGVLDIAQEYGLSIEDTERISDHYPVWAVFSNLEEVSRVAAANFGNSP